MDDNSQVINGLINLNNMLIEQVERLNKDNESLKERACSLESAVKQLIDNQKILLNTISRNQHEAQMIGETMTRSVDNVKYELGMGKIYTPEVASIEETVEKIVKDKASICRFGDGEFSIMSGASRQGFQCRSGQPTYGWCNSSHNP